MPVVKLPAAGGCGRQVGHTAGGICTGAGDGACPAGADVYGHGVVDVLDKLCLKFQVAVYGELTRIDGAAV